MDRRLYLPIILLAAMATITSCHTISPTPVDNNTTEDTGQTPDHPQEKKHTFDGELPVMKPSVMTEIDMVSLTTAQQSYNSTANSFALRILQQLYEQKSMVFSPLSLQMALSMVVNGAKGETAREILDVLGFGAEGMDALNVYSRCLIEQLPALDPSVIIQLADAMIVNDHYSVLDSYIELLEAYYYAPVANISFDNPDYVKSVINDWCSRNTHHLIPKLLNEDRQISPLDVAFILNALYFKAPWEHPFIADYQVKKSLDFHTLSGPIKVDYLDSGGYYPYVETDSFQMATRSLGKKGLFEMVIFLPKKTDGIIEVIDEMTTLDWPRLRRTASPADLLYRIPRFETFSSYSLLPTLKSMGIKKAFGKEADFSSIVEGTSLSIDDVIQKACFKLNEDDIEGAATTVIDIKVTSGPSDQERVYVPFYADHPFAYLIVEKSSQTILFAGVFDGK